MNANLMSLFSILSPNPSKVWLALELEVQFPGQPITLKSSQALPLPGTPPI